MKQYIKWLSSLPISTQTSFRVSGYSVALGVISLQPLGFGPRQYLSGDYSANERTNDPT